ncbi:hypothetical protein ACOMHN_016197 [Nucella lapillus]
MRYSRDRLLEIQPSTPNFELVNRLRKLRLGVGLPRKRGCRGGRKKLRSIQVVPSRNLHPLMVPPFLQPHPDLQSAGGNAPLSSKHPTQLPTTDCLLSIIPLMGGQPSDAPALSPPSPLQQGGQSSNAPALSPPSPLPQGGQPIALALSLSSPPPQDGQPSDAPGLSPSSSTLLLCSSDSTLSICHLNSQSAVKTAFSGASQRHVCNSSTLLSSRLLLATPSTTPLLLPPAPVPSVYPLRHYPPPLPSPPSSNLPMRYSRDRLLEIQPSTPNFELVNRLRKLRLGVGLPRKRGCRGGRKKLRSIQVVPSRNLHPLMVPPFLQPHPDLQSAGGNAPLSSKHPTQLPTTDCLLSIIPLMGGQPSDAPALSPPSPLQQGGQSSNAPALSPPSPLPQGGQPIALALSLSSPPPQDGQPSDAPGLSPSSSTLLLCSSDSTLSICHLNSQSAVKTEVKVHSVTYESEVKVHSVTYESEVQVHSVTYESEVKVHSVTFESEVKLHSVTYESEVKVHSVTYESEVKVHSVTYESEVKVHSVTYKSEVKVHSVTYESQ